MKIAGKPAPTPTVGAGLPANIYRRSEINENTTCSLTCVFFGSKLRGLFPMTRLTKTMPTIECNNMFDRRPTAHLRAVSAIAYGGAG